MTAALGDAPLISICVPTHHGRRESLSALLDGIVAQARDLQGLVEVCVSDNASQDGTAEAVAELARGAPCKISYARHEHDLGLARNLLAAIELARGKLCWLLGSDDLLAEHGLRRACELLEGLPGASGYAVGAVHVDAEDPQLRSRALHRAFHPPGEESRLIEGLDAIYDQCGNAWCALSWTIVDRERWLRVARARSSLALAHPVFPQVVMLAEVAAQRPVWGWLAEPLVRQRNATTFLFEHGDVSLAERWTKIIDGVAEAWAAVLGGRGRARWRRRMRLIQRVWGGAADMRATKLYDEPRARAQALLALACLRAFWPVREYWREVLPATLMPVWLTRARYTAGKRWAVGARWEPAQVSVSARLPERMRAGGVAAAPVSLHNGRGSPVPVDGAFAVTVRPRWLTAAGHELAREELGLNELAALPQSLRRGVGGRDSAHAQLTLYAPLEPGSYGLRVSAAQLNTDALEHVETPLHPVDVVA